MAQDFDSIRRFADALDSVLYDRSFEKGTITFFYDADVVIDTILGFFQFHGGQVRLTDAEYLVQALLSSGMFGAMHMLRPHALELDEKLRYQPDYRTPEGQEIFRAQVSAFLNERSVNNSVEELHAIVESEDSEENKRAKFVDAIRRLGPQAFVAIEFVKGTWKKRLRRYWENKQLVFESTTPEMHALFSMEEFRAVGAALGERRPSRATLESAKGAALNARTASTEGVVVKTAAGSALELLSDRRPAVSSVNNTRDAAAMAGLAYLMKQGRQVRFYTETRALQQVLTRVPEIRAMFSNPIEAGHPGTDVARCVVRDDAYLLVRAYMEALTESQRTEEEKQEANEEMAWVARHLRRLMNSHAINLGTGLAGLRIAGRRLSAIIGDIETLTFLQTVLRRGDFGEAVGDLKEWTNVWAFAKGLLKTDVLEEQILTVTDELRKRVDTLKTWFERQERVEEASRNLRERWRGNIWPHAMRDLGLIRWGIQVDTATDDRLRTLVGAVLTDAEQKAAPTSGSVVSAVADAPGNDQNVIVTCGVLWLLELFDLAFDVLTRHAETYKDPEAIPAGFRIWRVAAALRSASVVSRHEAERLFTETDNRLNRLLTDPSSSSILLGLGFVRFFAWRVGIRDSAVPSLEATEAAMLDDRSITSAFAVNQYAYIATMAKMEPKKTENALKKLRQFRASEYWHYRFADTLAFSDMLKAEKLLEAGNLKQQDKLLIRAQLSTAHELLSSIINTFGDSEIDEHILVFDQMYKRALERGVLIDLAPIRVTNT